MYILKYRIWIPAQSKRCSVCHQWLPLDQFSKGITARPNSRCKKCNAASGKARRHLNRYKEWKSYGVPDDQMEHCDHQTTTIPCQICGKLPSQCKNGRLVVDHQHNPAVPRGFLCDNCNRALGLMMDSPELLTKAVLYLENPPGIK